jgi:hypothetical protein
MREEYLGEEAHDLPLLLDPEGEGRLVGPQEVFGMARDQLIDDGDTAVLVTWMTSEKKTCPFKNTTSYQCSGSVTFWYGSGCGSRIRTSD